MWIHFITAALFLLAAIRDWFAPGLLEISGHRLSPAEVALEFVLGCSFCAAGVLCCFRRENHSR